MKVLVTGATGFIGKHLVNALNTKGNDVILGTRSKIIDKNLAQFKRVPLDLTKPKSVANLSKCIEDIDAVFHLASFIPLSNEPRYKDLCMKTNAEGTLNLLEFARKKDIKFIYSSSASVFGEVDTIPVIEYAPKKPLSFYGQSKLIGENYCNKFKEEYSLRCIVLRYSSVYGPGNKSRSVLNIFVQKAKNKSVLVVHNQGLRTQDFVYVLDVVQANLRALVYNKSKPCIFNIGSGEETTMIKLAKTIKEVFNNENKIKFVMKDSKDTRFFFDIARAKNYFGYNPKFSLEEGLTELKKYFDTLGKQK